MTSFSSAGSFSTSARVSSSSSRSTSASSSAAIPASSGSLRAASRSALAWRQASASFFGPSSSFSLRPVSAAFRWSLYTAGSAMRPSASACERSSSSTSASIAVTPLIVTAAVRGQPLARRSSLPRVSEPSVVPSEYGATPRRRDVRPQLRVSRLLLSLVVTGLSVFLAAAIVPGFEVGRFWAALLAALVIGVLSALLSPVLAAIQLPLTLATSFLLLLALNAGILLLADDLTDQAVVVDGFWWALLAALVISAISTALEVIAGTNDDDAYTIRVIQRIARRSGERVETSEPGILFLEIDGLAKPVLQRAMRDGNALTMARWLAGGTHRFIEWETDLSSQTGASQAGILLGSNENIPAFRWVEKETGRIMACSAPDDCAELERRHAGDGLLRDGGASRGNLLSGEADHVILTVSRIEAEMKANPGYKAFLSNGFNVTRALVLFVWEIVLEWVAALRAHRRDVQPRGHRG